MKLKQIASFLTALLLAAALAVAVSAAPEDETTTNPAAETQDGSMTLSLDGIQPRTPGLPAEDETQDEDQTTIGFMPYQVTVEQTTVGIMPVNEDLLPQSGQPDEGLFSQRNISLAALFMSGLAVLLSIAALVRTRKKAAPNATGNYQKYF